MRMTDHEFNRLTVLKKMRASQPISRTDLAQISGLTGGTITAIVRDLVQRGLVLEDKVETGGRGRPRINLSINPQGAYALGATLTGEGPVLIDILDLNGESVYHCAATLDGTRRIDQLAQAMADVIRNAIAASTIPPDAIAKIGIGLPAIVDSRAGVVLMLETFEPGPYAFADAVAGQLGIPVRLDNSNNLLARAAHWFGDSAGMDDFTLVVLDWGLGAACYQQGQLVSGSRGIEAELGHTKIVPDNGRPCQCHGFGCLQAYSAISGIVGQHQDALGLPEPTYLGLNAAFADMVRLARAGDQLVLDIFARAGRYLGIGLANHINMQDPDLLVIMTKTPDLVDLISGPMVDALERNVLPALWDPTKLMFKDLDALTYSRGAAAMVLEEVYLTP